MYRIIFVLLVSLTVSLTACGNDADDIGVGSSCSVPDDCNQEDGDQQCLTQFKGGYCGLEGCAGDGDCPEGSACVSHTDDVNYCFRTCVDKADCNANRSVDDEANCSSSVTFSDGTKDGKACIPPSD